MENDSNLKMCWEKGKTLEVTPSAFTETALQTIVRSRVRKQFKTVAEFVFAVIVYQIVLYSFLAHSLVRHRGETGTVLLCLAAAALYVPLTVVLLRRVRVLFAPVTNTSGAPVPDVLRHVEGEYARLASFFRFKKRLDWIGVPLGCAIIVLVTFTLFGGGIHSRPWGSLGLFLVWAGLSTVAIHAENRKRFVAPLRHLEQVLDDLKRSCS